MIQSAFAVLPLARQLLACGLLTATLAACGGSGGSGSSASGALADTTGSSVNTSLVSPNTGYIDRSGSTSSTPVTQYPLLSTSGPTTQSATAVSAPATGSSSASTVTSSSKTSTTTANNSVSTSAPSQPISTGTATLDWTPPTENSDGSVLTNLAGYTVYYGTSSSNLTQTVKITNPGLTAYTMSNLPSGTWYFSISAYSSDGTESARSSVVSTRI